MESTFATLVKENLMLLSVELNVTVDELYNFLLTGYDPSTKFTKTRLEILETSSQLTKRRFELDPSEEKPTDEQIDAICSKISSQLTSVLLAEGKDVVRWDGATPIVENAGLFVNGTSYDIDTIVWLHRVVKYAVLLFNSQ